MKSSVRNILCVLDPTVVEQPGLERATWLARHLDARLELFICIYNEYLAGKRFYDSDTLQQIRENLLGDQQEKLDTLARPLRDSGLAVDTHVAWDNPLDDGIVRRAARTNADLVIKDTHHHDRLERSLFSNTDWNLIRNCASPLWLVKPVANSAAPVFIAAIDPMHSNDKPASLDDKILGIATQLAAATSGKLHAFHAWDPRLGFATVADSAFVTAPIVAVDLTEEMQQRHEERFRELTEKHAIPPGQSHLVEGLAQQELPRIARELEASVVAIGAVSRRGLKRLFIGSTAEQTLEKLPCDLLIIKPDWYRTPDDLL